MAKFEFTRFGLEHDPTGAHVTFEYQGRCLIGTVISVNYDEVRCGNFLTVHYFNGEPWPIKPNVRVVDVLERSFDCDL